MFMLLVIQNSTINLLYKTNNKTVCINFTSQVCVCVCVCVLCVCVQGLLLVLDILHLPRYGCELVVVCLFASYTNIIILNVPISFSVKHDSTTKEKGVD